MTQENNPGCFASILNLFGIKQAPKGLTSQRIDADNEEENDVTEIKYPYRLRDDFLSPAEQSFFLVLKQMLGDYLVACPKVSLADLFFVVRPNENRSAINRINRKHVDFVVCDAKTMRPRFAIELDDASHLRPDREERDEFVDKVFAAAELPILHIKAQSSYSTTELGAKFKDALQQNRTTVVQDNSQMQTKQQASEIGIENPPYCPKCGVPMILRTARNGDQAGKKFYGCPNYPKCRQIIAV